MDYNKCKLKDLLKIIRDNQKTQEVQKLFNLSNLKYAKKKDIVNFLNNQLNIKINDPENRLTIEKTDELQSETENVPISRSETANAKQIHLETENILPDDDYESDLEDRSITNKKHELPVKEDIVLNLDNIKNKKKTRRSIEYEDPDVKKYQEECRLNIEKYRSRYPWLKFENINYDDPIEALKVVQAKVGAKNFSNLVTQGFYMGCDVVETTATEVDVLKKYCKLQGFANNVRSSDAIKDVLDELIIKYSPQLMGDEGVLSPEVRLCLALIGCAWATHSTNNVNGVKNKSTSEFKYDKSL